MPPLYLGDKIRGRSDRAEKLPPLLSIDCTSLPAGCIRHRVVAYAEIGCRPDGEGRYLKDGEMPSVEISVGSFSCRHLRIPRFAKTDEDRFNEHHAKNSSDRRKPPQRLI
jgi:hypothetical protein